MPQSENAHVWKPISCRENQMAFRAVGTVSFRTLLYLPAYNTANILRLIMLVLLSFRLVGFMIVNYISYPAKFPCQTTQQSGVFPIIWQPTVDIWYNFSRSTATAASSCSR